jgi:hypothetical protein
MEHLHVDGMGGIGKGEQSMVDPNDLCRCGGRDRGGEKCSSGLCPLCGKRMKQVEHLSDALIDATFEILAEEGAIWSGAR